MSLTPGDRVGPYQILAPLGAGGMGEVYRARDTKLERQVAVKVLPDAVARDPERLARFEREAKVLASLNHPNIAHIYGLAESSSTRALVMELVEGATLKGPLPLDTALDYAKQIADALEAAHDKGITHRDLKPANIMITPEGVIKVLDFGLAAVSQGPAAEAANAENSPTLTMAATQADVIMGTAAYMSPEQASGKPVDKRADIWAFGVVLSEMLTGKRLFTGETISHVMAAVLAKDPDLSTLPARVRPAIEKCLRKDPRKRWRDIGDVRMALDESVQPVHELSAPAGGRRYWLLWAVAGMLAVVAAWAPWRATPTATARPFVQLDLDVGPNEVSQPVLSPDGSLVVFVSNGQLATRRLDQNRVAPLAGTEGASFPFFSPNGQWVAFFADRKLKRIALDGGAPLTICDVAAARGGSWGEDNNIVGAFTILGGLAQVPAEGGTPKSLTDTKSDPEGMTAHRWPQVLPGSKGVIFAGTRGLLGSLRVLAPDGKMKTLVPGSTYGRFLPTGHLVYFQGGALLAAPMDLDRLELTGPAVPLAEGVAYTPNVANADFNLSPTGALVYVRGRGATGRVLSWMDSSGTLSPVLTKPREYTYPRISPDGKKLAVVISQNGQDNLWVYDSERDTLTSLPSDSRPLYPVWTPDGSFILYGGARLGWIRSDGTAKGLSDISAVTGLLNPWSISSDGRWFAYNSSIVAVDQTPEGIGLGTPKPLVGGALPAISPDSRLVAYASAQSDRNEVYVTAFPSPVEAGKAAPSGRSQVSSQGGSYPVWSQTSRELFYLGADRRIWVAGYTLNGNSFVAEKARVWAEKQLPDFGNSPTFDMSRDGKRAAVLLEAGGEAPKPETHIRVMLNVGDELHRRTAADGKSR